MLSYVPWNPFQKHSFIWSIYQQIKFFPLSSKVSHRTQSVYKKSKKILDIVQRKWPIQFYPSLSLSLLHDTHTHALTLSITHTHTRTLWEPDLAPSPFPFLFICIIRKYLFLHSVSGNVFLFFHFLDLQFISSFIFFSPFINFGISVTFLLEDFKATKMENFFSYFPRESGFKKETSFNYYRFSHGYVHK